MLIIGYYQELMKEEGISSTQDHYEAVIVDREKSEQLRQKMQGVISGYAAHDQTINICWLSAYYGYIVFFDPKKGILRQF